MKWLVRSMIVVTASTLIVAVPGLSAPPEELMLIGTHTSGPGQGLFAARLNPTTGALTLLGAAAAIDRPTWLISDPDRPVVYAASETGNDGVTQGGVYSLEVDRHHAKVTSLGKVSSGGGGATHLAYDQHSKTVFVANYGTGHVAAIPVDKKGSLQAPISVQQNRGSGPHRRQATAHAHGVALDPSGRFLLVADLGADRVFIYRFDPATRALTPGRQASAVFPPGSGPRHLAFSRDGRRLFVDTELTGQVYTLRWNSAAGALSIESHVDLDAPDFAGTRSAAELTVSRGGRFLYVSNRGAALLHVFTIDPGSGALTEIQRIAAGKIPWSFAFDRTGRWMVVADEAASSLTDFAVNPMTGALRATPNVVSVPKPVAITFVH